MKKIILFVGLIVISFACLSQDAAVKKGDNLVNVGIGLSSIIIPSASYEKLITDNIGVGPSLYYWSSNNSLVTSTTIAIGARGAYHFNIASDKFDLYGTFTLAYFKTSYKNNYFSSEGGTYWGFGAGGKYYFSNNIGAFAELGFGATDFSNLNIGVAFKF
ncbi:MAG: hypothetical protein JST29_10995 [Bacteroidetes bacterium]|nr:hypothetical protein [Bacteroidota bacterium]